MNLPHEFGGVLRPPDVFPLGLGYIATALVTVGHDVEVLDIYGYQYSKKEVNQKLKKLDYDVVGISALSTQYTYAKWLTAQIRKHRECKIIMGNALASLNTEMTLKKTETDICVIGEGELSIVDLLDNIDNPEKVRGICFKREDGTIVRNPPRELIKDLDSIGFPAWDLFPMKIYLKYAFLYRHPFIRTMSVVTGRGCPYHCNFCSKIFRGVRFRSMDNLIEEIKELKTKYGVKGIIFQDDLITVSKKRLYELCDRIKPLKVKWVVEGGRVNLVDFDVLSAMKKAGCVAVGYGIESGSQIILNNMNKGITVQQAEKAIRDTVKAGLRVIPFLMYGYVGETTETLRETLEFLKRLPAMGPIFLAPTTPLPATPLYDYALKEGLIRNEERYLKQLGEGFTWTGRKPFINLTSLTDEEWYQLKRDIEREASLTQIKRYPLACMKEWLLGSIHYIHMFGLRKGVRIGFNEVMNRLWRF